MKKHNISKKGKKVLSLLLAVVMVLSVASPAFSEILGITAKAAAEFDVELAFDNLFVFDHWVTNGNSMIIDNDFGSVNAGTITDINLENGSFRFTNNTNHNIYTRAAAGSGEKTQENFDYYRMPVEEGATYTFSCNFTGTSPAFYPHVFYYTESNEFTGTLINGSFSGEGDHAFNFTVPAGAKYIQLRLAIAGNEAKNAYAIVKDICVSRYNFEMDSTNLFSLDSWVGSEKSDQLASWAAYDDGRVTPQDSNSDGSYDKLYFETNVNPAATSGNLFTNFDYVSNAGYYSMDVKPSTDYTLSYNISGGNALHFSPYIVRYRADGSYIDFIGEKALAYGVSNFSFTTTAETEYIAVVFSIEHQNQNWNLTVQDIGVYETSITDYTVDPVRKTYTYNSSNTATYGTLPTPPAETYPDGYIFAGWYTGKDGTGTRIASDTPIQPQSFTVYPKFEPAVDSLAVATMPSKTEYTKGEKLNTAGLVLQATINNTSGEEGANSTFNITSGYYCTPEYLTSTGTQTITAHYGGKTATFTVNVSAGVQKNILVNGATQSATVANNEYILNYQATTPFNRYEMTYVSDSYVKGEITMDGITEEFFLEPSDNGSFASYIDSFLRGIKHYGVASIKFTCLDKEHGKFELLSLTTIDAPDPNGSLQFYQNEEYKVGIDLAYGGVVSYIEDLDDDVTAAVYTENGKDITRVDYANKLPSGAKATSNSVNLINTNDRGRYLQQSYYGTSQKPFEMGDYNGNPWPYNPVQGGNLQIQDKTTGQVIKGNESSKVIDYRITDDQIYVKTRPLDWGKNSVDYPDSYVTDSYMEAWYVFEDGMIKTYCRFVDFSGYPSHTRDQEMPALYTIEPLNHFVYNDVTTAWSEKNLKKIEEPDFWGVLPEYNALLKANGKPEVDVNVDCNENWAAFTASNDADSFGIGIYSADVTDFHYGCFPAIYNEDQAKQGKLVENYRHAASLDPAIESPTSYISPVDSMTFESYKPTTYSFYVTTGTADEIYDDFKEVANKDNQAELDKSKIAVPETVYMTPADGASKVGQYYVNNVMDENNNYNVVTEAVRDAGMYLGLQIKDAKEFSVKITNVTPDKGGDIYLCNTNGSEINESTRIQFGAAGTYENDREYGLRFSGAGLQPGEKATAKWEITVYLNDGTSETYTAYTVLYAPGRTVGAVAEARRRSVDNNETATWITGATSIATDSNGNHQLTPIGGYETGDPIKSGYFKQDPLVYPEKMNTSATAQTANDHINEGSNSSEYYVMQTAVQSNNHSRARSYLGLLTIDKSRYSNTNQIPNLKIGYDVLLVTDGRNDSLKRYDTLYTLGTAESFNPTGSGDSNIQALPSGWSSAGTLGRIENWNDTPYSTPFRQTVIPNYAVSSDMDGKYIHALSQGLANYLGDRTYGTSVASVRIDVTDKSELRDAVLNGYTQTTDDPEFVEALKNAGTVLGDPSASQNEIDTAKKELNNAMEEYVEKFYALKYDNLFSAYEYSQKPSSMKMNVTSNASISYNAGTLTVISDNAEKSDIYAKEGSTTDHYNVNVKPSTDYVFEYDVTTVNGSQMLLFFYDESGNQVASTNQTLQVGSGNPSNITSTPHFAAYVREDGHVVIKFTTNANIDRIGFRFGNIDTVNNESSFSNIKLIDAERYYADVTYSKTEDVYKEYASYGTMVTPVRPGYTFAGWEDADGNTVTGANIATEHKSIYSKWEIINYTITYNANGGSVTPSSQNYTIKEPVTLATPTRNGYTFTGWKVTEADGSWTVDGIASGTAPAGMHGNVTLTAQWALSEFPVLFDTILDFSKWNTSSASNATISDVTLNGFTLTSNAGVGEGTSTSPLFPVEAGKQYKIDIDITGDAWDVYIFFYDDNTSSGLGIEFSDGPKNRVSSNGTGADINNPVFTAPEGATRAVIRCDANGASNSVTFSDIRVYEANTNNTCAPNVYVPYSSMNATYGNTFVTLPEPTREGYTFLGWYDAYGKVTEDDTVTYSQTTTLYSKWEAEIYTIDFSANGAPNIEGIDNKVTSYDDKTVELYAGDNITISGATKQLTCPGATFLGWSTEQFAIEAAYEPGEEVNVSELAKHVDENNSLILHAVWSINEKDSLVEDKAVLDFGLSANIGLFDNDSPMLIYHVTGKNEETGESFNSTFDYGLSADGVTFEKIVTGKYGAFEVNESDYTISYTPTSIMNGTETVYYKGTITYEDGTTKELEKKAITVAPASNMLYEEGYVESTVSNNVGWTKESDGTTVSNAQDSSTASDIYGKDSHYANSTEFSNGTYYQAVVNSTDKKSNTATFTFTGTGIDLITACGNATGIYTVKITNTKTNSVKNYLIDTYTSIAPLLYQVPIITFRGDYGTYTVETTAVYLKSAGALSAQSAKAYASVTSADGTKLKTTSATAYESILNELEALGLGDMCDNLEMVWIDDNSVLNGGTGATVVRKARSAGATTMALTELTNYIDGFRVYNPLNTDSYYIASEQGADYYNIVNSFEQGLKESNFVAYAEYVDGEGVTVTQYSSKGAPKGEVYLRPTGVLGNGLKNDTIVFKVMLEDADSKVMLGTRAVNGATTIRIDASVGGAAPVSRTIALNSFTEMYYDISDIVREALGSNPYSSEVTITITNAGSGSNMLAINNLKLTNGALLVTSTNKSLSGIAELMFANREALPEDNETEQAPIAPDVDDDNMNEDVTNEDNTNEDKVETPIFSVPDGFGTFFGFLEKLFEVIGKLFNAVGIS